MCKPTDIDIYCFQKGIYPVQQIKGYTIWQTFNKWGRTLHREFSQSCGLGKAKLIIWWRVNSKAHGHL